MTREQALARDGETAEPLASWGPALALVWERARARKLRVAAFALACAALGGGVKLALPSHYVASEQVLFDPEGLKVLAGESAPARLDSNAQIDFVESQMGVMLSERVLARVLRRECGDGELAPLFARLCSHAGADEAPESARAVDALRRMYAVKRAERSFLVDVTATSASPQAAARLAGDLVDAYVTEDAATRAATAATLTDALKGRMETIRASLAATEGKAEAFRRDENLVRVGDKLVVEIKLADVTTALVAAQNQAERAHARLVQLKSTPHDETGLGALGDEAETRPLALLLERRSAAQADLAPLAATLGARNPRLIEARSRLAEVERAIAHEIASIREAARTQYARAERERENLAASAERLTRELGKARGAQIALQSLEGSAEANRKLLASFENSSREIAEVGRLDLANLRIASRAQAPETHAAALGAAEFATVGFFAGLLLSLAGFAFAAVGARAPTAKPEPAEEASEEAVDRLREASDRLRAIVPERLRFAQS